MGKTRKNKGEEEKKGSLNQGIPPPGALQSNCPATENEMNRDKP
jgi:hypothetical protein